MAMPNPFTGGTVIGFELPRAEGVRLEVFDLAGRRVRVLADGSYEPGRWSAEWDRRDAAGRLARPGVYLYRLKAGAFHAERKMVMMP
jgi:flagellar hook assembly protein FlgD